MRGWKWCAICGKSLVAADGTPSGVYMCGGADIRDPDDEETWICTDCDAKGPDWSAAEYRKQQKHEGMNNKDDGVTDVTFGDELPKAEPIPVTWEDQLHSEMADAAAKGVAEKAHLCDCVLCDSNSESGCPNEGTVLIGETWMCDACANSEAAVQRVEGEEEKA
jgi:hypothetical protein